MKKDLTPEAKEIIKMIDNKRTACLVTSFFSNDVRTYVLSLKNLETDILHKKISLTKGHKLLCGYSNEILKTIKSLENNISNSIILNKLKSEFRKQIKKYALKSIITQRSWEKPFGYPGDFKTIEMFYNNIPISKGIGSCIDQFLLNENYVRVVRNRKNIMKKKLSRYLKERAHSKLNIMNLGCGSCRELKELFEEESFSNQINLFLLDWETRALRFSKKVLKKYSSKKINFKFIRANVLTMYKFPEKFKILKNQDLVYSIGLADYLPGLVLGEIIKFCFNLLKPKGQLIIAHKNVKVHKSYMSDWYCNWHFYPRSKKDIEKLIREYLDKRKFKIKFIEEKTKHLFFVTISKF